MTNSTPPSPSKSSHLFQALSARVKTITEPSSTGASSPPPARTPSPPLPDTSFTAPKTYGEGATFGGGNLKELGDTVLNELEGDGNGSEGSPDSLNLTDITDEFQAASTSSVAPAEQSSTKSHISEDPNISSSTIESFEVVSSSPPRKTTTMSLTDAAGWLELNLDHIDSDEVILAIYQIRIEDLPTKSDQLREALQVIGESRNSTEISKFLNKTNAQEESSLRASSPPFVPSESRRSSSSSSSLKASAKDFFPTIATTLAQENTPETPGSEPAMVDEAQNDSHAKADPSPGTIEEDVDGDGSEGEIADDVEEDDTPEDDGDEDAGKDYCSMDESETDSVEIQIDPEPSASLLNKYVPGEIPPFKGASRSTSPNPSATVSNSVEASPSPPPSSKLCSTSSSNLRPSAPLVTVKSPTPKKVAVPLYSTESSPSKPSKAPPASTTFSPCAPEWKPPALVPLHDAVRAQVGLPVGPNSSWNPAFFGGGPGLVQMGIDLTMMGMGMAPGMGVPMMLGPHAISSPPLPQPQPQPQPYPPSRSPSPTKQISPNAQPQLIPGSQHLPGRSRAYADVALTSKLADFNGFPPLPTTSPAPALTPFHFPPLTASPRPQLTTSPRVSSAIPIQSPKALTKPLASSSSSSSVPAKSAPSEPSKPTAPASAPTLAPRGSAVPIRLPPGVLPRKPSSLSLKEDVKASKPDAAIDDVGKMKKAEAEATRMLKMALDEKAVVETRLQEAIGEIIILEDKVAEQTSPEIIKALKDVSDLGHGLEMIIQKYSFVSSEATKTRATVVSLQEQLALAQKADAALQGSIATLSADMKEKEESWGKVRVENEALKQIEGQLRGRVGDLERSNAELMSELEATLVAGDGGVFSSSGSGQDRVMAQKVQTLGAQNADLQTKQVELAGIFEDLMAAMQPLEDENVQLKAQLQVSAAGPANEQVQRLQRMLDNKSEELVKAQQQVTLTQSLLAKVGEQHRELAARYSERMNESTSAILNATA
ncbi:putative nuclear fusion protein [Pseudohyphozyma bogoriensis]|nr:putative nuclear fusion protein [Pseudohyphozyma bogoriensis]